MPVVTLKPPSEGNRTVPVIILWQRDGQSPSYTIHFNARAQQVVSLSQIAALHIDNTQCGATINVVFPDTNFNLQLGPNSEGFYPVVTNSLEFYAYIDSAPLAADRSVIQVLNFLPPPIEFGSAGGGLTAGTVRNVGTAAPLAGGPITDQGTVSLTVPLTINFGGTGGITGNAALDNLSASSGSIAGTLTRSAGGVWTVSAGAGSGTISAVNPGTGITGGGTSGAVTVGLQVPVTVANGGTGATTAPQALTNLGAAGLAAPAFTGAPTAPTAAPGTNTTQLSTTAFVQAAVATAGGAYVPLNGSVPMSGALTVKLNSATLPATPDPAQLRLGPADGTHARFVMDTFGTGAYPATLYRASRGTAAARTAVQNADVLGVEVFHGYDGSAYALGAQIYALAAENWTATGHGAVIQFATTAPGSTSPSFPVTIGQGLAVGGPDPGLGNIALLGHIQLENNQGIYSKDNGGTPRILIYTGSDNRIYIGFGPPGNFVMVNGHLYPVGDNTFLCGNVGNAWANVVSYIYTTQSDIRLKSDIAELPDCLDLVQSIEPKQYKYNNARDEDKDRVHWGFVAQDVAAAMQSAGHEFGGHVVGDDDEQTQGLSYSDLTAVLWKAVQELAGELAELKAKVTA